MHVPRTVFRLAYVCSGTVSEAEVYISPLLLFGCYRAVNEKKQYSEIKIFFFFALAYLAAQLK